MKHYRLIIIITALICSIAEQAEAQAGADIFGYFEPQYLGAVINEEYIQQQSNKLRIDLESSGFDRLSFGANINFITYHGKTRWNVLDYLPADVTSVIPAEMYDVYVIPFENRIYLDNAYLKIALKHADITAGRQQISMGTGYVWNPTDLFNMKDILDPTYEQPGHNALRLDVPLGNAYGVTALYAVGDDWKGSQKLVQFKGRLSHFDYSLVGIEKTWDFHDYTQFDPALMYFTELPEKRQMAGAALAGEVLGLGIWGEYGYNLMENTDDFHELVAGMDYTFDFQTYVLLEYYRNSMASDDHNEYTFNDWMRYMAAEQKTICRDQLYWMINHPVTDLVHLGLSGIYCISDNSVALIPTLNTSLSDNAELLLYLNFYLGEDGTAFAGNLGNGGMLRARIYF